MLINMVNLLLRRLGLSGPHILSAGGFGVVPTRTSESVGFGLLVERNDINR